VQISNGIVSVGFLLQNVQLLHGYVDPDPPLPYSNVEARPLFVRKFCFDEADVDGEHSVVLAELPRGRHHYSLYASITGGGGVAFVGAAALAFFDLKRGE
jgi:hypothetical protein